MQNIWLIHFTAANIKNITYQKYMFKIIQIFTKKYCIIKKIYKNKRFEIVWSPKNEVRKLSQKLFK